ncbi:hypothetical protein MFU01_60290 [Myxococcus fulvus]|uniref:Uncharacterized protein n=1 Tax=Myxococcus fulvus TaxID=33 RepID=A0A511TC26_MYXFU|nr:hypothetical protein MFU01_60290 [Myxococcus fulvus]
MVAREPVDSDDEQHAHDGPSQHQAAHHGSYVRTKARSLPAMPMQPRDEPCAQPPTVAVASVFAVNRDRDAATA